MSKTREVSWVRRILFRIETARKITQFLCFVLFNAGIFGLGPWPILLPIVHGLGSPQKTVGDAFGVLQWMLYELVFPWLPIASIIVMGTLLGRALCGWACPFGFIQDLLGYVKREHKQVSWRSHNSMIKVKYIVLTVTLFVSITLSWSLAAGVGQGYERSLGVLAPAPFNALSPSETLFTTLPRIVVEIRYSSLTLDAVVQGILSVQPLLWIRLAIMAGILVLAAYIPRSFCRYICPTGAALALLNRFSFLGLKRDPLKCRKAGCRVCIEVCPMKVRILELPWKKFSDSECTYCLKCVEACAMKAIRPKFP